MIRYKLASPEFFNTAQPPKCCLLLNVQLVSKYAPTNMWGIPLCSFSMLTLSKVTGQLWWETLPLAYATLSPCSPEKNTGYSSLRSSRMWNVSWWSSAVSSKSWFTKSADSSDAFCMKMTLSESHKYYYRLAFYLVEAIMLLLLFAGCCILSKRVEGLGSSRSASHL